MKKLLTAATLLASIAFSNSAFALDACKVIICLGGNWKGYPACVPDVREALRDMAFGHSLPHCNTDRGGAPPPPGHVEANRADNTPTNEDNCPVMYSRYSRRGDWAGCRFAGIVQVYVQGQAWSDVFWDLHGDTSTRYYPDALAQLPADMIDPTYDRDLAACGRRRCEPPPILGPAR